MIGAIRYGLYISREPYGTANIIFSNITFTGTSFQIPNGYLSTGTKYRWNMTAFNMFGDESPISGRLYFQTPSIQPPTVITQPQSQTVQASFGVTFVASATGTPPLNYQWRKNGLNIPGATNSVLTLNFVSSANAGAYSVVVTNAYGSVTSSTALLTITQPLFLPFTNQSPTTSQTTPQWTPPAIGSLKGYVAGNWVSNPTLNTNRMTVVLTHGWNSNPQEWATGMATDILGNLAVPTPNIVAWDWSNAAHSVWYELPKVASQTRNPQGLQLGIALFDKLGSDYSQPIHFIGHSLGTLVNAAAADYLHGDLSDSPAHYADTKTHVTLFDEAELAVGFRLNKFRVVATLPTLLLAGNFSGTKMYYGEPLPKTNHWADNYISAFGLQHLEASNIMLTNGFPAGAPNVSSWSDALVAFHSYPQTWYRSTVPNPLNATMGYKYSFEQSALSPSPPIRSDCIQAYNTSALDLLSTDYAALGDLLDARRSKYLKAFGASGAQTIADGLSFGQVSGESLTTGPLNALNMLLNLKTSSGGAPALLMSQQMVQGGIIEANGSNSEIANTPAYAWIPITVPMDAISLSFDFVLEGDGRADSFAVAVNGTNVLSLQTSSLQTNAPLNSGLIDVADYSGQEVEFFFGIVGGTSTNAAVTVSNLQFYAVVAPALEAKLAGNALIITWPVSVNGYALETSENLSQTNWLAVTNVPAIVDFEQTVTNPITSGSRFYRLKK